jgi:hypothetical protein
MRIVVYYWLLRSVYNNTCSHIRALVSFARELMKSWHPLFSLFSLSLERGLNRSPFWAKKQGKRKGKKKEKSIANDDNEEEDEDELQKKQKSRTLSLPPLSRCCCCSRFSSSR